MTGYTGAERFPSFGSDYSAIEFIAKSVAGRMMTATIVIVRAVGMSTVDVQPMVHQTDGLGNVTPHGTIHGLPVWRLQGGAGAVVMMPAVNDIGLAVFAREDVSNVKDTMAPAPPGSSRRNDYADGIYLGGLLNAAPTTFIQIDPTGTIEVAAPTSVTINTPMLVVTGDIQTGAGSTFNGKSFDNHHHSGVQTGSGMSGPPV